MTTTTAHPSDSEQQQPPQPQQIVSIMEKNMIEWNASKPRLKHQARHPAQGVISVVPPPPPLPPPLAERSFGNSDHAQEKQATISLDDRPLMSISYPSWRDLQNMKLQFKVNLNSFLTNVPPMSPRSSPSSSWSDRSDQTQRRQSQSQSQSQSQTQTFELVVSNLLETIIRWAMPNQIKMQVEYTYANFVVRL